MREQGELVASGGRRPAARPVVAPRPPLVGLAALQRSAGNAAVGLLVQRLADRSPAVAVPSGGAPVVVQRTGYWYLAPGSDQPVQRQGQRPQGLERVSSTWLIERKLMRGDAVGIVCLESDDPRVQEFKRARDEGEKRGPVDITLSTDPREGTFPPRMSQAEFAAAVNKRLAVVEPVSTPQALRYQEWGGGGLTSDVPSNLPGPEHFRQSLLEATTRARHVHVNLSSTPDTALYVATFASGGQFRAMANDTRYRVTADELYFLSTRPDVRAKATFYLDHQKLSSSTALRDPVAPNKREGMQKHAQGAQERQKGYAALLDAYHPTLTALGDAAGRRDLGAAQALAAILAQQMRLEGFVLVAELCDKVLRLTRDDHGKQPTIEQASRAPTKLGRLVLKIVAEFQRAALVYVDLPS